MRLIPGKTKVSMELFKGVRTSDIVIGGLGAVLIVFILTSSLPGKMVIGFALLLVLAALIVRMDTEPNYVYVMHVLRYLGAVKRYRSGYRAKEEAEAKKAQKEEKKNTLSKAEQKEREKEKEKRRREEDAILKDPKASPAEQEAIRERRQKEYWDQAAKLALLKDASVKREPVEDIMAFTGIENDLILYGGRYFGAAIEIPPVEFRFFSQSRRNNSIEAGLGRVLRSIPSEYSANIVKIERPVIYDRYLDLEYEKLDDLRRGYENGVVSEAEMQARVEVIYDRINELRELCGDSKVVIPAYYLVLFDSDVKQLALQVETALETLAQGEMHPHRLNTKELAVFLRYTNQLDFDEREIDSVPPDEYAAWAMPKTVDFKSRNVEINHIITHHMRVVNYPTVVGDAWMAGMMSIPGTKVVIKCHPMDRGKAMKGIDHSLQELRDQYNNTGVDSKRIELGEHIETLQYLLTMLQGDSESLLETNVYLSAYDIHLTRQTPSAVQPPKSALSSITNMRKVVKRIFQESGVRLNTMDSNQITGFIGAQVSGYDPLQADGRGIPSNTVAAAYPWIYSHINDSKGFKLGSSDGVPVFIDFFRRDSERVNSNMVIVGKSGSGKSYATKSLLTNLAADDAKIFILDPENEYSELAMNLHGKFINVGNAQFGRLNPFHIITALDDEESAEGGGESGSYATHLQFLEEFFRQILPDCDKDAMEYLNSLIDRMYTNMGISAETNLAALRPEDYPTFDDLYDTILSEFQSTDNEYIRTMLRTLMNYVSKFASGGRNANIWNGPSTITTEENFTVFNFQSLLANRNGAVANAQMLLVLKYIDNEIIKNRDYNTRYRAHRKVVVVIDEAHVFIDTKYPVALDFMFQLAKRIRKYNGMQIVITQNIKDFVGSEEIARKSTAIINACQYSFIFSLAPNDMGDLCLLYEKAGGINESEQEQIISAPRGQAFTIMSSTSRSSFRVEVPEDVVNMFQERDYVNGYFIGEEGAASWAEFLGDSAAKRAAVDEARRAREEAAQASLGERREEKKHITFVEVTAEEAAAEEERARAELAEKQAAEAAALQAEKQAAAETLPLEEEDFEIPELPEDPAAFEAMRQTAAVTPPAPAAPAAVPAAAPSAPQMVIQTASDGSMERMVDKLGDMVENMSRLSIESVMASVRSMIAQNQAQLVPEAPGVSVGPALGGPTAGAAAAEESSLSLGSIFNDDAMEEAAALDAAQEESEASSFDIMSLLNEEAEKLGETSPVELMEIYGEEVIEITLEELAVYNRKN